MPPFIHLFPALPTSLSETMVWVVAALGAALHIYGIFLKAEKRQDAVFAISAACLLVYAIYIHNVIFIIAMSGFMLASLWEFVELVLGYHGIIPKKN